MFNLGHVFKPTFNPIQKKSPTIVATIILLNLGIIGCSGGSAPAPKYKPEASENEASKKGSIPPGGGHPGSDGDPTLNNLGFHNFGASCYANAALKFLWAMDLNLNSDNEPQKPVLPENPTQDEINGAEKSHELDLKRFHASKDLRQSIHGLLHPLKDPDNHIATHGSKNEKALNSFFGYLEMYLKSMKRDIEGVNTAEGLKWKQLDSSELLTIFLEIFESAREQQGHFYLTNRVTRVEEGSQDTLRRAPLPRLELDIHPDGANLSFAIDRVFNHEEKKDLESYLGTDHPKVKGTLSTFIQAKPGHLPNQFVISLKRFDNDGNKILHSVEIPSHLDFPYVEDHTAFEMGERKLLPMRLKAGVVHKGKGPKDGHYYAYILKRKPDGSEAWFLHNDSVVREVSEKTALDELSGRKNGGGQGYYFLYERIEPQSH